MKAPADLGSGESHALLHRWGLWLRPHLEEGAAQQSVSSLMT